MKLLIFILGLLLSSGLFAQTYRGEAYYQQALKRFDSVKVLSPDSIIAPSLSELDSSAAANEYLHQEMVAAFRWEAAHFNGGGDVKSQMEKIFAMPFDSIQNVGRQYGDDYLVWLYSRHLLSPDVQERLLVNRLDWYAKDGSLPHARRFLRDLEVYFPQSMFMNDARAKVQVLESKVAAGKNNAHIVFRRPVRTLDDLVAPYKGKVVYLDIWGTWCGPCRAEMKFAPALKQHIDTAKVVFLYLDMDADENDVRWREYVQMNNIAGEHLRMNSEDLEPIWVALLHTSQVPRYYPSFFIFGKDGKLTKTHAKRPSDKEALYAQLRKAVGQP
ncbi:MAG TPA: TlpA disulfide reductase family protein [Puia sp.]|nr:TlpA disulfide reductase family protein [Puia sp.]